MTGEWQVTIYMKLKAGRSLTCTSNDTESAGYQPTKDDEDPPWVVAGATSGGRMRHLGWSQEAPRMEPCVAWTKGFVAQGPQDRSECFRRPD